MEGSFHPGHPALHPQDVPLTPLSCSAVKCPEVFASNTLFSSGIVVNNNQRGFLWQILRVKHTPKPRVRRVQDVRLGLGWGEPAVIKLPNIWSLT